MKAVVPTPPKQDTSKDASQSRQLEGGADLKDTSAVCLFLKLLTL